MTAPGEGNRSFGTTPEEARAELARLNGPDGDYYKAVASGDQGKIAQLKPKIDHLSRIAAGTKK